MADRSQFLKNYGNLVGRIWENESIVADLKANPVTTLNAYGFDVPEGSTVNLIFRELNTEGSPDTQAAMFDEAASTGIYNIVIPTKPENVDVSDLPLQEEVLDLMGGAGCCPCSTCCCPCCGDSAEQQVN